MAEENTNTGAAEAYQSLLAKHNNDANAVSLKLFGENYDLRAKNRELAQKLPKDGAFIGTPDDKRELDEYRQFLAESKLDFKQIKETVGKVSELETKNRELSQMETLRAVADIGIEGRKLKVSVLQKELREFPEAQFNFKNIKGADGKELKAAFITIDGKESSFTEFANEKLADYLPALLQGEAAQQTKPGNMHDPKPHTATKEDIVKGEVAAQMATGRYSL